MSMEQKWREEQRGKTSWFWSSFASSFTSTIVENLQVRERGKGGRERGREGEEEREGREREGEEMEEEREGREREGEEKEEMEEEREEGKIIIFCFSGQF